MHRDKLTETINQHEAVLLRYAWRLLGDESLAQDAVQVAFIRYCRQVDGAIAYPRAWLFKTVRNECFNVIRKRARKQETDFDSGVVALAPPAAAPDAGLLHDESREVLLRCFDGLKPREKEILTLKIEHGKSYREIAEIMQLSAGNVGFILHVAMKRLKQAFSEGLSR